MSDFTLPPIVRHDLAVVVSRLVTKSIVEGDWNGTPHWLFTKAVNSAGYGQIWHPGEKRLKLIHRISQEAFVGPIPDGYDVDHLCRVRNCWNPLHTEAVTGKVNNERSVAHRGELVRPAVARQRTTARGRRKADTCQRGHGYTDANTSVYISVEGYEVRTCLACLRKD